VQTTEDLQQGSRGEAGRAARSRIREAREVVAAAAIAAGIRAPVIATAIGISANRVDALVREAGMFTQDRRMFRPKNDDAWMDSLTAALNWSNREGRWPRAQAGTKYERRLGVWINSQRAAVRNVTISRHREGLLYAVGLIA
jgi:hypothetical protein